MILDGASCDDRKRRRRRRRRSGDDPCVPERLRFSRHRGCSLAWQAVLVLVLVRLDRSPGHRDCGWGAFAFTASTTSSTSSSSSSMILSQQHSARRTFASADSSIALSATLRRRARPPGVRLSSSSPATADTADATAATAATDPAEQRASDDDLRRLTVKQLRELVRTTSQQSDANHSPPRGLLSKLRLKKDLIAYLEVQRRERRVTTSLSTQPQIHNKNKNMDNENNNSNTNCATSTTTATKNGNSSSSNSSIQKKTPLGMPARINGSNPPKQQQQHDPQQQQPSRKDLLFEKVLQRYPTAQPPASSSSSNAAVEDHSDRDSETTVATTADPVDDDDSIDVRQRHHPALQHLRVATPGGGTTATDMDLVLVGTASCTPGVTRGVSCTALRLNWKRRPLPYSGSAGTAGDKSNSSNNNSDKLFPGGTWLFDVGECTQLQVQKTSAVKPSKISKIFVTHAHGDHSFGLPGLLCLMGQDRGSSGNDPIEIYGPEGLRMWLRVAIRYSVSRIVPPYVVHELCEVPMAPEWEFNPRARRYVCRSNPPQENRPWRRQGLAGEDPASWISQANLLPVEASPLYGEVPHAGRNLYPVYDHPQSVDGAPVWEVCDEGDVLVRAAPMSHGIPCLGYVVEERPRPGRLRQELVEPIVKRNLAALREAGFAVPMKAMAVIKNLEPGSAFTFPDGTVVRQEDAVEPPRPGRKVAICGDTADARALAGLAAGADVVVHECTNAYLAGIDPPGLDWRDVARDAILHGHSTPQIAGDFARRVRAKRLVLHHFSARYKGDTAVDSLSIMMRIEQQAMEAAELNETQVVAGWDMMVLPIPPPPPTG